MLDDAERLGSHELLEQLPLLLLRVYKDVQSAHGPARAIVAVLASIPFPAAGDHDRRPRPSPTPLVQLPALP